MTVNPFPWHRPKEDPRAHRVEPLVGGGSVRRKDRTEPVVVLALVAGVGAPLAILVGMLVLLLAEAPVMVQVAPGFAVGVGALLLLRGAGAFRRRSAERTQEREARGGPRRTGGGGLDR